MPISSIQQIILIVESFLAFNYFVSPKSHKTVLQEREQAIEQGLDVFIDWEIAKKDLRHQLEN